MNHNQEPQQNLMTTIMQDHHVIDYSYGDVGDNVDVSNNVMFGGMAPPPHDSDSDIAEEWNSTWENLHTLDDETIYTTLTNAGSSTQPKQMFVFEGLPPARKGDELDLGMAISHLNHCANEHGMNKEELMGMMDLIMKQNEKKEEPAAEVTVLPGEIQLSGGRSPGEIQLSGGRSPYRPKKTKEISVRPKAGGGLPPRPPLAPSKKPSTPMEASAEIQLPPLVEAADEADEHSSAAKSGEPFAVALPPWMAMMAKKEKDSASIKKESSSSEGSCTGKETSMAAPAPAPVSATVPAPAPRKEIQLSEPLINSKPTYVPPAAIEASNSSSSATVKREVQSQQQPASVPVRTPPSPKKTQSQRRLSTKSSSSSSLKSVPSPKKQQSLRQLSTKSASLKQVPSSPAASPKKQPSQRQLSKKKSSSPKPVLKSTEVDPTTIIKPAPSVVSEQDDRQRKWYTFWLLTRKAKRADSAAPTSAKKTTIDKTSSSSRRHSHHHQNVQNLFYTPGTRPGEFLKTQSTRDRIAQANAKWAASHHSTTTMSVTDDYSAAESSYATGMTSAGPSFASTTATTVTSARRASTTRQQQQQRQQQYPITVTLKKVQELGVVRSPEVRKPSEVQRPKQVPQRKPATDVWEPQSPDIKQMLSKCHNIVEV